MTVITKCKLVRYESSVRDSFDQRKKVSRAIFSYYDSANQEYRRAFYGKPNAPIQELDALAPSEITLEISK